MTDILSSGHPPLTTTLCPCRDVPQKQAHAIPTGQKGPLLPCAPKLLGNGASLEPTSFLYFLVEQQKAHPSAPRQLWGHLQRDSSLNFGKHGWLRGLRANCVLIL